MGQRIVRLQGFEEGLVEVIAAGFTFDAEGVSSAALVPGRNLFVDDMPEREQIAKSWSDFDGAAEPVVSIYNPGGASVAPSLGSGSRHEWSLRIVVRFGTVFELAKQCLEQLIEWIERSLRGRAVAAHYVKGVFIVNRPSPFQRTGDAQAYCTATVRILAVPRASS